MITEENWEIRQTRGNNEYGYSLYYENFNEIAEIEFKDKETALDNARLIAASPLLLDACKELLQFSVNVCLDLDDTEDDINKNSAIRLAKQAIAKAENTNL